MERFTVGYYLEQSGFRVIHTKPGKIQNDGRVAVNYRVELGSCKNPDEFRYEMTDMIIALEDIFLRRQYKITRVQKSGLDRYRGTLVVILPLVQVDMFGGTEVIV